MKLANQQKVIVGVASLAVLVLLVTTVWSRPGFEYKNPTAAEQKSLRDKQEQSLAEYRKYLDSIHIDPVASSLLWDQVLDKEQIAKDIRADIGADKPVVIPKVKVSDLRVAETSSPEDIRQYLTALQSRLDRYHAEVTPNLDEVLNEFPDPAVSSRAATASKGLVDDLYEQSVPKVAVSMHSSILSSYTSSEQLFADVEKAAKSEEPSGQWKHLNPTYVAMRTQLANMDKMARELDQYAQTGSVSEEVAKSNVFIPVAQAVAVSVLYDIPRRIEAFLKSATVVAVINYSRQALTQFVKTTEQNYLISNYLYFTDASINAKYSDSWLKKYINNPSDQEMIKRFLPQFNCGRANEEELRKTLRAKAIEYLGFDPKIPLDPTDPAFYEKLSRVISEPGDVSGEGWKRFYQGLAATTEGSARAAANQELAYSGKKTPLDPKTKDTVASLDTIKNQQKAATNAMFEFNTNNVGNGDFGFDKFMVNQIFAILKQFTIKGTVITRDPKTGKVTVNKVQPVTLKEQKTCVQTPVLNPVIPGDFTPNKNAPTEEELALCLDDVEDCQRMLFQSPYGSYKILPTCPELVNAIGPRDEEHVVRNGLMALVSPTYAKIDTPLEIDYLIQPSCGYITEKFKQDTKFSLTVYGGDFVPTDRCSIPTDPDDPNLAEVVQTQNFNEGSQLGGHVTVDSRKVATRYEVDSSGRYKRDANGQLLPVLRGGKQAIVLQIIGNDRENGAALCLNTTVEVNLELPDIRS